VTVASHLLSDFTGQLRGFSSAFCTGISVPFLGAIERGEKWPSPSTLVSIAQALGVTPHDMLKPEEAASQDIKKITAKLVKDINALVNQSVKQMNTVANEPEKK